MAKCDHRRVPKRGCRCGDCCGYSTLSFTLAGGSSTGGCIDCTQLNASYLVDCDTPLCTKYGPCAYTFGIFTYQVYLYVWARFFRTIGNPGQCQFELRVSNAFDNGVVQLERRAIFSGILGTLPMNLSSPSIGHFLNDQLEPDANLDQTCGVVSINGTTPDLVPFCNLSGLTLNIAA